MANKQDLVNKKISLDDFNLSAGKDPNDLPKAWKDAGPGSSRPKEFQVKLYHDEDDTYYVALGTEYGGFKDDTAVSLGCSEPGTWIQASSLKKEEEILARIAASQPKIEEKKFVIASSPEIKKEASQTQAKFSESQQTQNEKVSKEGSSMDNGQMIQAGVRVVADKLTNLVRNSLLKLHRQMWLAKKNFTESKKLKREDQMKLDSYLEGVEDMLRSEFGKAAISYGLGYLLKEGKPRLQKYLSISGSADMALEVLSNEFQVAGMAAAGSSIIDKFFEVCAPQAGALLATVSPNIKASEFEQLAKDSADIIGSMNLSGLGEQENVTVSNQKSAVMN